ncbi:PHP domain-containing protein [candidate division KSB1 bacterium]|nr:PHP domain-containing protein [candidate division KSB1 bacterium]
MAEFIDLHIHSTHSDGLLTPEEIVTVAVQCKLQAISITDHDNISAIRVATNASAGTSVEVVPGIELSACENKQELHILGYFINDSCPQLIEYLAFLKDERLKRARRILEKLQGIGIDIHLEEVLQHTTNGNIVRPHIADILVARGHANSRGDAFYRFIGDKAAAYVPKTYLTPEEAIQLIHLAGGVSFLAHPPLDFVGINLNRWVKHGLDGLEVFHPRFGPGQILELRTLALKNHLLESGGSDFHGEQGNRPQIGAGDVPVALLQKMKAYHQDLPPHWLPGLIRFKPKSQAKSSLLNRSLAVIDPK